MLHNNAGPHSGRSTIGKQGQIPGLFTAFRGWPRLCVMLAMFCSMTISGAVTSQENTFNPPHYFGDLNGDGRDDVLLRHTDGRWHYYPMNGRAFLEDGQGEANLTRNPDWQFAGIGDLNGDGKDDVLVRRVTDGRWYYYPMDGRRHLIDQRGGTSIVSDPAWQFAGTGDLNGDGKDDVLLRHRDDGRWLYYPMDGRTHIPGGRGLANIPRDQNWQFAGIGDLNGDGRDDVLLRHTNGTWQYFPMDGRDYLRSERGAAFLTSNRAWGFAGIGDLNGDGKDDVLVRHVETGRWYYYPMDGRRHLVDQRGGASIVSDPAWQLAGIGDLNGDGKDDVLLRHRDDGRWLYYPMDGLQHITDEHGTADLTIDLDWNITATELLQSGSLNQAPEVNMAIPADELTVDESKQYDLGTAAGFFSDPDGDALTYTVSTSDSSVVRADIAGSDLDVEALAEGSATITVTATDPGGLSASASFTVTVAAVQSLVPPEVYEDNLIILTLDEMPVTSADLDMPAYSREIYRWFDDAFDYLLFLLNLDDFVPEIPFLGRYYSAWNETQGTGHSIYFDSGFGSDRKLRGVLFFPFYSALVYGPSLHELLHSWANYTVPTVLAAHWGFSSANGQLGGFDLDTLVDLGGGQYTTTRSFGTFANSGNTVPYSSIELYFAGLIAPEEVPDLWVAENGAWLRDEDNKVVRSEYDTAVFTADFEIYTIEDIRAEHGARIPDHNNSQKHYRAAVILLIDEDHPATLEIKQQVSEQVNQFSYQGTDKSDMFNYYEATGGRSTITMGDLSGYRKEMPTRAPSNRPASFGESAPPVN